MKMIDHRNLNHRFPLPLMWVKRTTLPLEVVSGRGGIRGDLGVEAPTTSYPHPSQISKSPSTMLDHFDIFNLI